MIVKKKHYTVLCKSLGTHSDFVVQILLWVCHSALVWVVSFCTFEHDCSQSGC